MQRGKNGVKLHQALDCTMWLPTVVISSICKHAALHGALVLANTRRLELGNNILVLIQLFSPNVTAEALRAKSAISLQRGPVDKKIQVEWVASY